MKIIFTDVDGTIYDKKSIVLPETIRDINYAQSKGIEVVLATGNPIFSKMKWLSKKLSIRYIISSNGATIYDNNKNEYIYKSTIPFTKIEKMAKIADELKIMFSFWNEKHIFVNKYTTDLLINGLKNICVGKTNDSIIIKYDILPNIDAFKAEVYSSKDLIDKFEKKIKNIDINIARISKQHLEISNLNISKKEGAKLLSKKLGIDYNKCMTIGDSGNDKLMLESSKYSYAMGNAPDNIKKNAKFITDHVLKNGLGKAILDYIKRSKQCEVRKN